MSYFEPLFKNDFRLERRNHISKVTGQLPSEIRLIDEGLIVDYEDTERVRKKLVDIQPDVLLVVPTMASPPALIMPIIEALKIPTIIACAHELTHIDKSYDMAELCRHSINVGTTMVNSLVHRKRNLNPPIVVAGFIDEDAFHQRLKMAVKVAGLAKKFKTLQIGRLGPPMNGYDHVGIDDETAKECGLNIIDIPLQEWSEEVEKVSEQEIQIFLNQTLSEVLPPKLKKKWSDIEKTDDFVLGGRMAVALDHVKNRYGLDCGSLTCRGSFGMVYGVDIIGCLATSFQTSIGTPFSATGDLVTSLAMYIGKYLGGATLYCELDAVDRKQQSFLVANTGEGDFSWCPPEGEAEINASQSHSGRETKGVVIRHDLFGSSATMIGVTLDRIYHSKLSLIALDGETSPFQTSLKVTHGWFKTELQPPLEAFELWVKAAATHHGALSRGKLGEACQWLAQLLDIPFNRIKKNA